HVAERVDEVLDLAPEGDRRWERGGHAQVLSLDQSLEPPVAIARRVETLDRLAGARQVVELPALLCLADLALDPRLVLLHPALLRAPRPSVCLARHVPARR